MKYIINLLEECIIGRGLAASPGAVVGRIAFSNRKAEEFEQNGHNTLLCKKNITMEDFNGLYV